MGYFEQMTTVKRAYVRCGTHDKSLNGKRLLVRDAADFAQQMIREIESNEMDLQVVEIAGIFAWTAVIVTDIVQDATQVTPTGRGSKFALMFLGKVRDRVASEKFKGSRYKQELDKIDRLNKVLKVGWPAGKEVINTFTNLTKNMLGLTDHLQSSAELRQSNVQQKRMMVRQLKRLLDQLRLIEQRIDDDSLSDDGQSGPRMSVRPTLVQGARMPWRFGGA